MALIKQINVGGTSYRIGINIGNGLVMTGDGILNLNLGTGLIFGSGGMLCVSGLYTGLGSGLVDYNGTLDVRVSSGLESLVDGVGVNIGSGLTLDESGGLTLKIDTTKLKLNSSGQLTLA